MSVAKTRIGRPPKNLDDKRVHRIPLMVTEREKKFIAAAAKTYNLDVSNFCRDAIFGQARSMLGYDVDGSTGKF